jgi:hypothetical protein
MGREFWGEVMGVRTSLSKAVVISPQNKLWKNVLMRSASEKFEREAGGYFHRREAEDVRERRGENGGLSELVKPESEGARTFPPSPHPG